MKEFHSKSMFLNLICSKVQQNQPRYPANTMGYIVLHYNRFVILFKQMITLKKQKQNNLKTLEVGDGQGSLTCCSLWSHKESDTTE